MKNKRIDNISNTMSKYQGIFTKNVSILFSNVGQTEKMPEF